MELCFINNNAPLDRHSQRLVRNHAMKGKNLGKIILARGHKSQRRENRIHADPLTIEPKCSTKGNKGRPLLPKIISSNPSTDPNLPLNPFSGTELAYFVASVPLTPSVRYLFYEFHHRVSKELYPRIFCRPPKENESVWFERVIEAPCVFHCAMAITKASISHSRGYGGKSVESDWHLIMALRQLRRDLGANSKVQDSSIVVSISLAIYANLNESINESRIHLQALKRVLELRPGGLAVLCSNSPEVGNKIRRSDLELALLAGTPTLFGSQTLPLPRFPYLFPVNQSANVALPHPLAEASHEVQYAMMDVLALCSHAGSAQLSAFQYQNLVISILQRLIDYAPLGGERPLNQLDDVCQLGLLAFMSTVLNHTRESRVSCSKLLYNLLRISLSRFEDEMASGRAIKYPSLYLWLTFIYALSAPEYEQFYDVFLFVTPCIQLLVKVLSLETWEDVSAHLILYPWVVAFHDEPSKKLWAAFGR